MADWSHIPRDRAPLVVGLGASAGGIQALRHFFTHAPPEAGIAYAVILHLSPDHDSKLAEVLQSTTTLRVSRVTERVRIEPDHVYVVPPNKSLEVRENHFVVSEITRIEQRRAPVDVFFRALADAHGSRSAAVVLSGTGPNGSAGLKRIKEYGGLTIAQEPSEAEHGEMPRNAIATGLVDYVLPVSEMSASIQAYYRRLCADEHEADAAAFAASAADPHAMREVLALLRVRTGHDFSNYKPATLQRRVQRRASLRGLESIAGYARTIREQPDEALALMRELLISVTNFFRDPTAFDALATRVVPRLFEPKHGPDQVRVWVPGCATGEEAYSIAMLLAEHASAGLDQAAFQLFATDLDERAIAAAREGFYTDAEIADVSEERLQRFFQRETAGYRVRRELRETVLFAHHNVITDPPFSHLDLISCRNLLIYLNRPVQDRLVETFHFALRPGGYLFVGVSETADATNDMFRIVDKDAHIYESRTVTPRLAVPRSEASATSRAASPKPWESRVAERILPADLHHRLLEH